MAVKEQRPVDGSEVEEHDQQNQQHPRPEHKWESSLGIH
nr:unnamed protein product [Digitaria exilis]